MQNRNLRSLTISAICAAMLTGCATKQKPAPVPPTPVPAPTKPVTPPYTWNETDAKGPAKVEVDLSKQRVYFYRGDVVVGETRCSTGKKGFATVCGSFTVTQKDKNHMSNLYGSFVSGEGNVVRRDVDMSKMKVPEGCSFRGAKMPFYMRFHSGYGLHAGHVPDYPASHGCVRLPRVMAERLFENCVVGTPVIVHE
ncbi:MAG: L,D-transpeptidase family protein [Verrucomicrobiales bacterium]